LPITDSDIRFGSICLYTWYQEVQSLVFRNISCQYILNVAELAQFTFHHMQKKEEEGRSSIHP